MIFKVVTGTLSVVLGLAAGWVTYVWISPFLLHCLLAFLLVFVIVLETALRVRKSKKPD